MLRLETDHLWNAPCAESMRYRNDHDVAQRRRGLTFSGAASSPAVARCRPLSSRSGPVAHRTNQSQCRVPDPGVSLRPAGVQTHCMPVVGEHATENWAATWHGIEDVTEQFVKLEYYRFYVLPPARRGPAGPIPNTQHLRTWAVAASPRR